MKILHQTGHNSVWNRNILENENCGDGLILSPVHDNIGRISNLGDFFKEKSIFDPQFYVPNSQKNKLNSYDFFPENYSSGFSTTNFSTHASDVAKLCTDFQIENDFELIIIPARYYDDMVTDYIIKQKNFTVEPFLEYIVQKDIKKDIFLTLPLNISMLIDSDYRKEILNWVTSYPEITGVYLLVNFSENTKQIMSFDNLFASINFINILQEAELKVLFGYCNTEALLFATQDIFAVTMGAYENTRNFTIDKFLENDSEVRGPAPRIYFPNLLNWVRYNTAIEIKEDFPSLWEKIYTPTEYMEKIFATKEPPHFTKPELYYHHFMLINNQLDEIRNISTKSQKIQHLKGKILKAHKNYQEIDDSGIILYDKNCSGEHLPAWNRLLTKITH